MSAAAAGTTESLATSARRFLSEIEFDSVYRRLGRPLMNYVTRLCGDSTAAEDLFQRTFLQVLRSPVPIDDDEELKRYIYRIATNVVYDHWRRRQRGRDETLDAAGELASRAVDMTLSWDVERVFAQLDPRERAILWWAHVEGCGHREIAGIVGVKEKSVKVLLFRARRRLAALLRQAGWNGGER